MQAKLKNYKISVANIKLARRIAEQYVIVIWKEDGEFHGDGVELPNVYGTALLPQSEAKASQHGAAGLSE